MEIEIVGDSSPEAVPESNELDKNSQGGTELMKNGLYKRLDQNLLKKFQIIPSRVRDLDPDKKKVLWLHDLPQDPESQHLKEKENVDKFDKIVCVSHWQMQQYANFLGLPYSKCQVLKNAITPFPDHTKSEEKINIIYHTTPHRGLELLVPVMEQITKMYDDVHLDVFSSFNAYGWPERDEPYQELFDKIEEHPQMTYHGFKPNNVVRNALQKAHIFAYPSIWMETSCIALMEAMSAGLMCVHPNLAALPETAANWTYMYQFTENPNDHANRFGQCLIEAIELYKNIDKRPMLMQRLNMQKVYANSFYSWDSRKVEWEGMLRSILES